jgi:SAM-dependent methyltransferase
MRTDGYHPTSLATAEHVIWCYRSILGREPESDQVIQSHLSAKMNFRALVLRFIGSPEYRRKKGLTASVGLGGPAMDIELNASQSELLRLIERVQMAWTEMGKTRPHHSVLSGRDYLPQNINERSLARFWASGSNEAATIAAILKRHGFHEPGSKTSVEYGCGLGRVSFALANVFRKVRGYDISPTHIAQAQRRASDTRADNIEFHLCSCDVLSEGALVPCDFFYSRIVFQHNPPPLIRLLITRSLESLRPDGIAIFQVPTYGATYSFSIREYLASDWKPDMEMHCIPQHEVFAVIADAQCQLLEVREDNSIGRHGSWVSNTFVAKRLQAGKSVPTASLPHVQSGGLGGR